jgi:DNA-binding PadR family transcriptional regulator
MYELIILSLLMRFPTHGYLIAKITNDQIGPWARISSGTLYTILAKLEQEGMIAVPEPSSGAPPSDRRSRTFLITDEGRKRFHQIMMDTVSGQGDYQRIFRYKFGYLDLLTFDERMLLLDHYANYCQTSILYLESESSALVQELASYPHPSYLESLVAMMRHIKSQWEGELAWVRAMRAWHQSQSRGDESGERGPVG